MALMEAAEGAVDGGVGAAAAGERCRAATSAARVARPPEATTSPANVATAGWISWAMVRACQTLRTGPGTALSRTSTEPVNFDGIREKRTRRTGLTVLAVTGAGLVAAAGWTVGVAALLGTGILG